MRAVGEGDWGGRGGGEGERKMWRPTSHRYSVLGVLVCVACGDPPTAPGGSDSCHSFTEGHTPFSLLYWSHHLNRGGGEGGLKQVVWFQEWVVANASLVCCMCVTLL